MFSSFINVIRLPYVNLRINGKHIVLANKNNRQIHHRRKIHTFIKDSFFRRPVAKKTTETLFFSAS